MPDLPLPFAQPQYLFLALLLVPVIWCWNRRHNALGHPGVDLHKNLRSIPLLSKLCISLFSLSWLALVGAVARPMLPEVTTKESRETRDFVIGADISGSMFQVINDPEQKKIIDAEEEAERKALEAQGEKPEPQANGNPGSAPQGNQGPSRIQMARYAIKLFVKERKGDRVALIAFDDQAYYCWPLTADLEIIADKARLLGKRQGGGTNFDGPSESAPQVGAFQAAINHFQDMGKARTKVIIFVSDGDAGISEKRHRALVEQMTRPGETIRIYAFVIGEKSAITSPQTESLRKLVAEVGGEIIAAGDAKAMRAGFDRISQLEKSKIELEKSVSYRDITSLFLASGLLFLGLFLAGAAALRENA